MIPEPAYLALALGTEPVEDFALVQHDAGLLQVPSGGVVCCDPLVFAGSAEPFSLPLPVGSYRVILTVAKTQQDARVGFARAQLRDTRPVEWDLMTLEGQGQSQLGPEEIFGYGVDALVRVQSDERDAVFHDRLLSYGALVPLAGASTRDYTIASRSLHIVLSPVLDGQQGSDAHGWVGE